MWQANEVPLVGFDGLRLSGCNDHCWPQDGDDRLPDVNQSTRTGELNTPWFLMKSRGMTHGNLRKRPCMAKNWGVRVSALRNGKY